MNQREWPIVKDGFLFALPLAALSVFLYLLSSYRFWVPPAVLALFVLFFFRNPGRETTAGEKELLSPADGKVMLVAEIPEESEFLSAPALKVSIFLNIFNVHINRSPIAGRVMHIRHKEGKFLPAYKNHASEINERNYLGLETEDGLQRILLVQIVGLVARRVVCWSGLGDSLKQGERFGLMRFGSCVELYLPMGTVLHIKPGDRVKGGLTVLGRLPDGDGR